MAKLCSSVLDLILKKWPTAELYIHNDTVIHDRELMISLQNRWFITMTASSRIVSMVVYKMTTPLKDGNQGYQYTTEYQIGRPGKDGKHTIKYLANTDICQLAEIRLSMPDLINNIVVAID